MSRLGTLTWEGKLRRSFQKFLEPHHIGRQSTLYMVNANRKHMFYLLWKLQMCSQIQRIIKWTLMCPSSSFRCYQFITSLISFISLSSNPFKIILRQILSILSQESVLQLQKRKKHTYFYLWRLNAPKRNYRGSISAKLKIRNGEMQLSVNL